MYGYNVVRAIQFGKPVAIRPELSEKAPSHVDMLRYDLAFCSPMDPSLIVFPVFQTKHGKLGGRATHRRWDSFGIRLQPVPEMEPTNIDNWTTYRHPVNANMSTDYAVLEPVTLRDYMKANPSYKLKNFAIVI